MNKLFSILVLVIFVTSSLNANSGVKDEISYNQPVDDCNVHATVVALQAPAYGISY